MKNMRNYMKAALTVLLLSANVSAFADQNISSVGSSLSENGEKSSQVSGKHAQVSAIGDLIATREIKRQSVVATKRSLKANKSDVDQKELMSRLGTESKELAELDEQIGIRATGVPASDFDLAGGQEIDLQKEAEQLIQPFVIMLKSATSQARHIEQLKHKLLSISHYKGIAEKALKNIQPLLATSKGSEVADELQLIDQSWRAKLQAASDMQSTVQHQLESTLAAQADDAESAGSVFGDFFRERGLSVLMGVAAFVIVLTMLKLIARAFSYAGSRGGVERTFRVRLSALIFNGFSFMAALGAMLYVFNARNDWLLLGLVVLFVLALTWMGLKMLPQMIEQITMLLNLGAVQEGERVFFEGVPWNVKKLDFYSELENPVLAGGSFTVPVRELLGLHSRPADDDEVWFVTRKGDWVKLEDGTVAKVVFQSPEMVQVVELGGARQTFTAPGFFEQAPTNLSFNSRVEIIFGLSYKHQAIGAREIPEQLAKYVRAGLLDMLDDADLLDVNVELMSCNASSLDYEVEADLSGAAADRYEDVERALTRLCLEACNEFGWEIPFPQLVVHKG